MAWPVEAANNHGIDIIWQGMQENDHEIYALEPEEILGLYLTHQINQNSLSPNKADDLMKSATESATQNEQSKLADYFFNQYPPVVVGNVATWQSAIVLERMFRSFGGVGQAIIKEYHGKTYVIFKGYPGLRRIITGTRYGIANVKIISMAIGKMGARHLAVAGARVTFIAMLGYRVLEFLIADEVILGQFIASLATDVVKIAIGTDIAYGAALVAGTVTSIAIGPLIAVVLAGIVTAATLEHLDNKYEITSKMAFEIDRMINEIAEQSKRRLQHQAASAIAVTAAWLAEEAKKTVINYLRQQFGNPFDFH